MQADRWFYVNDRGDPSPIGEAELRNALRRNTISPKTLVWRAGWTEWIRAERVRQFEQVLGNRARQSRDPSLDHTRQTPPPVPAPDEEDWSPRPSTPVPPQAQPQALVRRPAQPTINDIARETTRGTGNTLRPPGAVPPPPRGVPRLVNEAEDGDGIRSEPSVPTSGSGHSRSSQSLRPISSQPRRSSSVPSVVTAKHTTPPESVREPDAEVPPKELSAPQQAKSDESTVPLNLDSFEGPQLMRESRVSSTPNDPRLPRAKRVALLALGLAVVSATLGVWLTLRRPTRAVTHPGASTSQTPIMGKPLACTPTRPAQRVAPSVLMAVAPVAADAPVAGRILVGFAESPTTALGISVDPTDLDIGIPYREQMEQRVISVTPLSMNGHLQFFAWREDFTLRQGRVVDASHDFLFGLTDAGFARQPIGGEVEAVWAVDAKTSVTDPRLSSIPGVAHAVAFRQSGQDGTLMLGWLNEVGQAMAGPYQIQVSTSLVGTPSLATSKSDALVAFAGRMNEGAAWSVHMSHAEVGHPPTSAVAFEMPKGGPGGDSISPAVISLTNHRWLLQWSEGAQGQRQVRVQTLDALGHPIGVPHTVSPVGSNSGQGLLWSSGQRAVSFFVVSVGKSAELWATPISCPE